MWIDQNSKLFYIRNFNNFINQNPCFLPPSNSNIDSSTIRGNNRTRGYEEDALSDSNQILSFLRSDCIMNARPSLGLELSSILAPHPTPSHFPSILPIAASWLPSRPCWAEQIGSIITYNNGSGQVTLSWHGPAPWWHLPYANCIVGSEESPSPPLS